MVRSDDRSVDGGVAGGRHRGVWAVRRPNVVLVTVDSLRADAVGDAAGHAVRTPHLDGLFRAGTVFSQAIANGPRTQASFPSILCSLYPLVAGEREGLPASAATLGEAFQAAGYRTAAFNPSNPFLTRETGYHRGFDLFVDFWDVHPRHGDQRAGGWRALKRKAHDALGRRDLGALMLYQAAFQAEGGQYLSGGVIAGEGLAWAREQDRPFFLWLHFMDVHFPYTPLPGQRTRVDRVRYLAALAAMAAGSRRRAARELRRLYDRRVELLDAIVGELLAGFRREGLEDRTVVAFTADHGERFWEHRGWAHGPDVYDELLRVPLALRGPEIPAGIVVGDQVPLIGLAPTLLDLAGVPAPASFQGRSFLPALLGEAGAEEEPVFAEAMHSGGRASRMGVPDRFRVMACRTPEWKLLADDEGPTEELYDLAGDPGERNDLVMERPEIAASLRRLLRDHQELVRRAAAAHGGARGGRVDGGDEELRRRLAALGYL